MRLVVHVTSDRNSCVMNKKDWPHKDGQSLSEMCVLGYQFQRATEIVGQGSSPALERCVRRGFPKPFDHMTSGSNGVHCHL